MLTRIQILKLTLVILTALSCLLKNASPAIYINEKYISIKKTLFVPNKITVNNRILTTSRASHTLTDIESKLEKDAASMNTEFIAQSIQLLGTTRLIELSSPITAPSTTFFMNNQLQIYYYDTNPQTSVIISIDPLSTLNIRTTEYINKIDVELKRYCVFGSKLMFVYGFPTVIKAIFDMETNSFNSYQQDEIQFRADYGYACNYETEELYLAGGNIFSTSVVSIKAQTNENHDFNDESPIPEGGWRNGICVHWDNILLCANGLFTDPTSAKSFSFNVPLKSMSISPDGLPNSPNAKDFVQYRNNLFVLTTSNSVKVYEIRTGMGITPSFVEKYTIAAPPPPSPPSPPETWDRIEVYSSSSIGKLVYFRANPSKIKVIFIPSI